MAKIEIKGNDVVALSGWLKRFSAIDKSLLFEVDTTTQEFIAKTYSEDRALVKMSKASFGDLGLTLLSKPIPERVKVGIYDIQRINKTLGQFSEDDFSFEIHYELVETNETKDQTGSKILLKNSLLKVGIECLSLTIFQYISDNKFETVIANIEEPVVIFDLRREDIERIMTLGDLDKDFKKISFRVLKNKVYARSKSFEFQIGIIKAPDQEFPMKKEQFAKLDVENYQAKMGISRMSLTSTDSDTVSVIGVLNENEYDNDKEMDLN